MDALEQPLLDFVRAKFASPVGWSATQIEINGELVGGVIVVRGERAFDLVVQHINSACRKPSGEKL
jgi:hypothetical protein